MENGRSANKGKSGKKCETEVTNKGETETMGSSKDDRFARSANRGKRVNEGKTKTNTARKSVVRL